MNREHNVYLILFVTALQTPILTIRSIDEHSSIVRIGSTRSIEQIEILQIY